MTHSSGSSVAASGMHSLLLADICWRAKAGLGLWKLCVAQECGLGVQRAWLKDRTRALRVYCVIETTALHTVPVCCYNDMFFMLEQ